MQSQFSVGGFPSEKQERAETRPAEPDGPNTAALEREEIRRRQAAPSFSIAQPEYRPRFAPVDVQRSGAAEQPGNASAETRKPLSFDEFLRERARYAARLELAGREGAQPGGEPPGPQPTACEEDPKLAALQREIDAQRRLLREHELRNERAELELRLARAQKAQPQQQY